MNIPLLYQVSEGSVRLMDGRAILDFFAGGDDNVFIVNGKNGEMYLVDDPAMIKKCNKITRGHSETEALDLILKIINPGKYGK